MAIRPIVAKFDYDADRWIWGLSPEDFDKIAKGYGCSRCLEDFNGKYVAKCPTCGEEINTVVETPEEWRSGARSHSRS